MKELAENATDKQIANYFSLIRRAGVKAWCGKCDNMKASWLQLDNGQWAFLCDRCGTYRIYDEGPFDVEGENE